MLFLAIVTGVLLLILGVLLLTGNNTQHEQDATFAPTRSDRKSRITGA